MGDIKQTSDDTIYLTILLWAARIIGTVFVLFFLLFFFDNITEELSRGVDGKTEPFNFLKTTIAVSFLCSIIGLIIASWKELAGALISLICMVVSFVLMTFNPSANFNFNFLFFLVPSLLYLLHWYLEKSESTDRK